MFTASTPALNAKLPWKRGLTNHWSRRFCHVTGSRKSKCRSRSSWTRPLTCCCGWMTWTPRCKLGTPPPLTRIRWRSCWTKSRSAWLLANLKTGYEKFCTVTADLKSRGPHDRKAYFGDDQSRTHGLVHALSSRSHCRNSPIAVKPHFTRISVSCQESKSEYEAKEESKNNIQQSGERLLSLPALSRPNMDTIRTRLDIVITRWEILRADFSTRTRGLEAKLQRVCHFLTNLEELSLWAAETRELLDKSASSSEEQLVDPKVR